MPNPTSADRAAVTVEATSKAGVAKDSWERPMEPPPPPPPAAYNGTFSGTGVYDENELGPGSHMNTSWSGSFHASRADRGGPPGTTSYAFQSGSVQFSFNGHTGGCDVSGNGVVDLSAQPDYTFNQGITLISLDFQSPPRKYQLQIPGPLFASVPGTKSNCDNPDDDGDSISWSTNVPYLAYSPFPGGPVGDDWSISGSGAGNSGGGSPDQTWQWQLAPVP